jgi:Holliday junction resolvase RusA-like endonuclease
VSYEIEFTVDVLPKSQTNNYGSHWARIKAIKEWRERVWVATHGRRPEEPLKKATVHFIRRSSAPPDYTNLVASFKPVEDALVKCGIILDDNPKVIGYPTYAWEYAAPKKGGIIVRVKGVTTLVEMDT